MIFGILLVLPIAIGGILHMVVVRLDWFVDWARPIAPELFGKNKTYRGFLVMPITCTIGMLLTVLFLTYVFPSSYAERVLFFLPDSLNFLGLLAIGPLLGLAYAIGELPNSFLKRRLGVPEGQLPKKSRWFFFLMDHFDSTIPCAIIYQIVLGINFMTLSVGVMFAVLIHTTLNFLMYLGGLRREPF
jgi:CDP-diacylglycerol--serine O-phosphatidyltransferase